MRDILNHERFWLFAPFVGLFALAIVTFGLWHLAASRLGDEMAGLGLSWQSLEKHGYPARISIDMRDMRWRKKDRLWQNDNVSVTMMPFQGGHAIVDFHGTHRLETATGEMILTHQGNLASLVADAGGLIRGSFEAEQPHITTRHKNRGDAYVFTAEKIGLHSLRDEKPNHYKVALMTKGLHLPDTIGRAADAPIPRLDVLTVLPTRFLQNGPEAGQKLVLERLTMERGGLTLIARGTVKLHADGNLVGRLDIDAIKLEALLDLLQEFNFVSARDRAKWLFFGGLGAALGGNPQDRLSIPLIFKSGRTLLGPLDLGPAPRWQ